MNLREAIEAGAHRVEGRATGTYLLRMDGRYRACALGAAYLGCHPDEPVAGVSHAMVARWVSQLNIGSFVSVFKGGGGFLDDGSWVTRVMNINDGGVPSGAGWDDLLDELGTHTDARGRTLADIEVCETPGGCDESA